MSGRRKKVVLIHPPITFEERYGESKIFSGHIHPPQGLCHLAAVLIEKGFDSAVVDSQALFLGVGETVQSVMQHKPDYIGIATFTIGIHTTAELYTRLKEELNGIPIILGGPHVTACPHETFARYPFFEIFVLGEGELSFPRLLQCLEEQGDLRALRGIAFKEEGQVVVTESQPYIRDLDILPRPRWDLLPHLPDHYRPSAMTYKELPAVAVVTSRGCPCRCTFCDRSVFGQKWRAHSPSIVLSWIEHLVGEYGIKDINFQDDHFLVDKTRLREICSGIKDKFPGLLWSAISRVDGVDQKSVELMRESGCWQIAFGIESGSQRILDLIKKDVSADRIRGAVRVCKEAGMTVKGLFMVGAPGETPETLSETSALIEELRLDYLSIAAFTPIPNTEIYSEWHKYGNWIGGTPEWSTMNLWEPVFIPHGLSKEDLQGFIKRAPGINS